MTRDAWQPPEGVVPPDVDPVFEAVASAVTPWLGADPTGHGLAHAWRVFNTAMALAEDTPTADREVLGTAALVHDVHRAMGLARGEYVHPEESLDEVEAILERFRAEWRGRA